MTAQERYNKSIENFLYFEEIKKEQEKLIASFVGLRLDRAAEVITNVLHKVNGKSLTPQNQKICFIPSEYLWAVYPGERSLISLTGDTITVRITPFWYSHDEFPTVDFIVAKEIIHKSTWSLAHEIRKTVKLLKGDTLAGSLVRKQQEHLVAKEALRDANIYEVTIARQIESIKYNLRRDTYKKELTK